MSSSIAAQPDHCVVLRNVGWNTYKQLLSDLGDGRAARLSYWEETLSIMSPSRKHEKLARLLSDVAKLTAKSLKITIEDSGSVTLEREDLHASAEPDGSFYIANEPAVRLKMETDLTLDPPPDLVIEVDVTSGSRHKLSIYRAFGVPEIWHYDDRREIVIFVLKDGEYQPSPTSASFPVITAEVLQRVVAECQGSGQAAAIEWFETWLRETV